MKRWTCLCLAICLCLCLCTGLVGCRSTAPRTRIFYSYFDTVCTLYAYGEEDEERFERCVSTAEELLAFYHKELDIYHEYDGLVNLCTLNRTAGEGPQTVSDELFAFLSYAKSMYDVTAGQTNVAMGAVLSLWHDAREAAGDGEGVLPEENAIRAAGEHINIDALVLNEQDKTVELSDSLLRLDAGAIGKGYVAERIAEAFYGMGVRSYAIDLGGNLRTVGYKPNGAPFTAAIRDPLSDGGYVMTVSLTEGSCVTSGSYERYMTVDGVRYHHIIDPETLYPATHFVSVTVLCRDSGLSDALSTALFCLSYEEGCALLDTLEGVRAVFVTPNGTVLTYGLDG